LIPGPRMKISVGALSQTGGHGDETMPSGVRLRSTSGAGAEWPETLVDGPDEVRKATRELLRAGADFIKLHATGGVLSPTDEPTDTGFTPEEIAIMVYEARARGKTCMAHAQGTQGIKNAAKAGAESREHRTLTDEEAIVAATKRASECVHMADQIGTLEPGKLADLLIVDGDPLADISILKDREKLLLIMQGGRAHKNALETRATAAV